MDKNTITGLLLIGLTLVLFNYYSANELESTSETSPSEQVETETNTPTSDASTQQTEVAATVDSTIGVDSSDTNALVAVEASGPFAASKKGSEQIIHIENDDLDISISTKGGRIVNVNLKGYRKHDSTALELFQKQHSDFSYLFALDGKQLNSNDFYFTADSRGFVVQGNERKTLKLKLHYDEDRFVEQTYSIGKSGYLIDYDLRFVGLQDNFGQSSQIQLEWGAALQGLEKGTVVEKRNSTIHFKFVGDGADDLSATGNDTLIAKTPLHWISFKQQFFNTTIIAHDNILSSANLAVHENEDELGSKLKDVKADIFLPVTYHPDVHYPMQFYIGPNHYSTLVAMDMELESVIPLGWGPLSYVNTILIIPIFNFLSKYIGNYGIIILLLTIFIKLLLSFFTYKSYVSTAKMKLLKPELEELKAKFKDSQKLNMEQMKLYRQAGVNPLGGCIPMLLQFPFLVAMFYFFPSSIELRQESFLWATDLSTYDSIYNFPDGVSIPFYGDHVSLFTLLMTVSTILYTKYNSQMSDPTGQMAQMKYIQYLMPIMFLGIFNDFSSGLTYYYFLANLITFGQQYIIKNFIVNDEKLHAQLQQNKKKKPKESGFSKRLEKMAKDAQAKQKKRK